MILKTTLRITPITEGCREEFQYLYIWNEPYEVVDASYFVFGKNRDSTLINLKNHIYKLMYINLDCTSNDIIEYMVSMLNKKSKDGVFITESDISDITYSVFNLDIPSNISEMVKTKYVKLKGNGFDGVKWKKEITTRIVEWKPNINGLLVLDNRKMQEIRSSGNIEKEMSIEYKKIKIKYIKMCMDKLNNTQKQLVIESSIDVLREGNESATIKDISSNTGLSVNTVRKYVSLMADRLDFIDGFKVIRNKIKNDIEDNINNIEECIEMLRLEGIKVNKMNIHKHTGISRPTIDKYWNMLDIKKES